MKRILLVSPPFSGHLNVLKTLAQRYADHFEFSLVITGWTNVEPDLSGFNGPVHVLATSDLNTADPAQWTFQRMVDLIPALRTQVETISPDLIIYDFFSLEAFCVGKEFGIPVWCSIPAFLGPNDKQTYLAQKLALTTNREAWEHLQQITSALPSLEQIEMISDGFHVAGDHHLVWSYRDVVPSTFRQNRHNAPYAFLGNLAMETRHLSATEKPLRPVVYLSLGTVVMDNLWNQREEVRAGLITFFQTLARLWDNVDFDVVCVTRNKPILSHTPNNWRLVPHADQLVELAQASVFVTHGGSNSFHESLVAHVPMVVVPFFGDQPLVAEQVEKLGLGHAVIATDDIDTQLAGTHLNEQTAQAVDERVRRILSDRPVYQQRFAALDLRTESFLDLMNDS